MKSFLPITICICSFLFSNTGCFAQSFHEIGSYAFETNEFNGAIYYFSVYDNDYYLTRLDESNTPQLLKKAWFEGNMIEYEVEQFNQKLYYGASEFDYDDDGNIYGQELWVSDGTVNGTYMVKDINLGIDAFGNPNGSYPDNMTVLNGHLYFIASDATHGRELWVSDGTEAGTHIVKDVRVGTGESYITEIVVMNNRLYFFASSTGTGFELWTSDGSEAGTYMVPFSSPETTPHNPMRLRASSDLLYFGAKTSASMNNYNYELWSSDGEEVWMVTDINGTEDGSVDINSDFTVFNDKLFFTANDGVHGKELWSSDGTEEGTVLVKDIAVGADNSSFYFSFVYDGNIYFKAHNPTADHSDIWKTDGTEAGTELFFPLNESLFANLFPCYSILNGKMYLQASVDEYGAQLWRCDLDGGNIERLMPQGLTAANASSSMYMKMANNSIYYNANFGEIWELGKLWKYVDGNVSVDDNSIGINLNLYPNPTNNNLMIQLPREHNLTAIEIIDASGKMISTENISHQTSLIHNVSSLAAGVYFVKLYNGRNVMQIKRFIKN